MLQSAQIVTFRSGSNLIVWRIVLTSISYLMTERYHHHLHLSQVSQYSTAELLHLIVPDIDLS